MPSPSAPGIPSLSGGCLCQEVRFQVQTATPMAVYCHCAACRRASGAAMAAWLLVPQAAFVYSQGYPRCFLSAPLVQREFCPHCGTALLIRPLAVDRKLVRVALAALDDPCAVRPQAHIWTQSRLPWVELGDDLPRYAEEGPFAD